jgi:hypothetical protein
MEKGKLSFSTQWRRWREAPDEALLKNTPTTPKLLNCAAIGTFVATKNLQLLYFCGFNGAPSGVPHPPIQDLPGHVQSGLHEPS